MPNIAPVPVLKVNITEITLPNVIIEWDATGSHDIDKNGNPVQRKGSRLELFYNGVAVDMLGQKTGKLSVAPVAGKFPLVLDMYDNREEKGSTTIEITVKPAVVVPAPTETLWGLKIQRAPFSDQRKVAELLGITCARPNSIGMMNFNGDIGNLKDWYDAGYLPGINVDWNGDNTQKPFKFLNSAADIATYKANFEKFCQLVEYMKEELIIFIGNEPTNDGYYTGPTSDYLAQLRMSIDIAHKYGLKVSDGCIHLELVELIRTGNMGGNKNAPQVKELMDGYKSMTGLYAVNVHFSFKGTESPVADFGVTCDFIRAYTGHELTCNEFSQIEATAASMTAAVEKIKKAKFPRCVAWSGDGVDVAGSSKATAYNIGTVLTDVGIAYRDAIK